MITYLVTKRHAYTIKFYLKNWGLALAGRFRVEPYESFLDAPEFEDHSGTYIFSDIERLSPLGARRAAQVCNTISELGGDARILNHPTRSMRRYELLRTLFERGDNTFNVYKLTECRQPQRWPVFIREENEHTKNLTELLHTPEELEAAVAEILARGDSREDKLVVEFCDTRDEQGLFYKYGAFLIGERVIPRSLPACRDWVVGAGTSVWTPDVLEKERRYVETNPHERVLREIFRHARINYGRIDYSILGDRLQVWEINTNPVLFMFKPQQAEPERRALLSHVAEHIAAAFAEIDVQEAPYEPGPKVSISL